MIEVHQIMKMLEAVLSDKKEACKCLQCDAPADPQRRGLCSTHYSAYYGRMRRIRTTKGKREYDKSMVQQGLILKSEPGGRPRKPNPFPLPKTC